MSRIHVVIEGQTEEGFVRDVIVPYLADRGAYLTYSLVHTRIYRDAPNAVGGVSTYGKFKHDIQKVLGNPSIDYVSSFLDYYALPHSFPGRGSVPQSSAANKVKHVEQCIDADIANPKFGSYLALHEFEALLFADPTLIQEAFPERNRIAQLQAIRDQFVNPEEINDSPHTAPSTRLKDIFGDEYQKTLHGPLIAGAIGLTRLRQECPHFDEWMSKLESI